MCIRDSSKNLGKTLLEPYSNRTRTVLELYSNCTRTVFAVQVHEERRYKQAVQWAKYPKAFWAKEIFAYIDNKKFVWARTPAQKRLLRAGRVHIICGLQQKVVSRNLRCRRNRPSHLHYRCAVTVRDVTGAPPSPPFQCCAC